MFDRPITRRRFLRRAASGAAAAATLPAGRLAAAGGQGKRPHILMILVDDLGYGDLSSYGAKDLRTPHVDALVAGGMRFSRFYANCPVCSPTRAALLTGRFPAMVGVPGVIRTHDRNNWGHLSRDADLLGEVLKTCGYDTALVGKWHLGLTSPNTPNDRGFDHVHGFLGDMMDDYYTHRRHGYNYMRRGRETIDPKGHATDLFTDWACEWLKAQSADKPFFLYLAYNAPHTPIQPPDDWLAKVHAREGGIDPRRAKLVALIEHMDDGIGRVLQCLDDTGLAADTLVVFWSDNGGQLGIGADNDGTRDGKGTLYEGGIRVPAAIRWPGKVEAGQESDRVVLTMDVVPTLCEAAGAGIEHAIDGVSFLPFLRGEPQPEPVRDLFWGRREGGKHFKGGTIEGMRRGDWKLLRARPGGPLELYNLAADPLEKTDLAATEPDKAKELTAALEAQLARYAQIPWQPPRE